MLMLILSMAIILVTISINNLLVSTYKNNEKYNSNDDIDLASRSALNVAKAELLKYIDENNGKIFSIDELEETYDLTDDVKKVIGKDEFNYKVKAILDKDKSTYTINAVVADKTGVSSEGSQKIVIDINPILDVARLIPRFNIISCLGDSVPSVKISTSTSSGNPSSVRTDIWYVESLETDLNNMDYIGIHNNKYGQNFVNSFKEGDPRVEIKDIKNSKKGQWTNDLIGLLDNIDYSEEIYAQDGSGDIIGYRKKIDDVSVVLINGSFNLNREYANSHTFKRTIIYATDSINIDFQDLRMDNACFIAGENINLKLRSFKQLSYINFKNTTKIQEFIRKHVYE